MLKKINQIIRPPVFLIALFMGLFFAHPVVAQKLSVEKLQKQIRAAIIQSPQNNTAGITIAKLEGIFITIGQSSEFKITWLDQSLTCELYYAARPGLGKPENYPNKIARSGTGELQIIDEFKTLPIGIYYCILRSVSDPTLASMEFKIYLQPQAPVRMFEPEGSIAISNSPPEFRWQPINGVPYYYILLSQGELEIIEDENGDIDSIIGLNIIWQAFTENAALRYGDSDRSGTWPDANTPLLLPGIEYNWVVFSAFAPDLRFVAWQLFPLSMTKFTVERQTFSQKPEILLPQENAFIAEDEIQFSWRSVPGASRYHIYLQQILKNDDLGEGTILFWQQATIDTTAVFNAKKFLAYKRCKIRVIAENSGKISVSDEHKFIFNTESGYIDLQTRSLDSGSLLPYTSINLKHPSGTSSPFPFFSGDDGHLTIDLAAGTYRADGNSHGYLPATVDFIVNNADSSGVLMAFKAAEFLLAGRILDAVRQMPVPFAKIKVPGGENFETDGAGNFTLATTAALRQITAHALGYETQIYPLSSVYQNGLANIGDILLQPASSKITGKLADTNGQAVSGGTFIFKNENYEYRRKFNQSGRFEFALESGAWDIRVENPGYYSIPPEANLVLAAGETRPLFLVFSPASIINGKVVKDGVLIGSGTVQAKRIGNGEILQTHISNYATFRFDLQAGSWEISVDAPGVGFQKKTIEIAENVVKNVTFSLAQATFIAGSVYNAATNEPLVGVKIFEVSTNEVLAETNTQGEYQFSAIANKTYQLSANITGFIPSSASVTAAQGIVTLQDFYLQQESTQIRGRVLHNSTPVADAEIYIEELNVTTRSDAAGLFAVNVSPGIYNLTITADCLDPFSQLVVVSSSVGVDLEIVLSGETSVVSGYVFDENGIPLAGANILTAGTTSVTSQTDSFGYYSLCFDAGAYFFLISHVGYLTRDTTFVIAENDSLNAMNFYLQNNFATLSGNIKLADGQPVAGIQLIFSNTWQQFISASDAGGLFLFSGLYPGQGVLIVRSPDYYAPPQPVTLVGRRMKTLEIVVTRNDGYISGTVRNHKTGAPIPGARVTAQVINGSQLFTAESVNSGNFLLQNLPSVAGVSFKITAEKDGFALINGADSVAAFSEDLELTMLSRNSAISGRVIDSETGLPLAGIQVSLQSFNDGYSAQTTSSRDGSYIFGNLVESFRYSLQVQDSNFLPSVWSVNAPAFLVDFNLQRLYAYATGQAIFLDSQMAFRNAGFIFTSTDGLGKSDTVITNRDGRFFARLWPGQYQVHVEAPLYYGAPSSQNYVFTKLDTTDLGVYTLEKQALNQLQIDGPSILQNVTAGGQFRLSAFDSLNRSISSIPSIRWSVDISADTASFTSSGYLNLDPGFIGELHISVFDSITGMSAAKRIEIIAQVDSTTDFQFFGREKQLLVIAPGTVEQSTTLSFAAQVLTPVQNVERDFRAINPVVKIVPNNIVFAKPAQFSLPAPANPVQGELGILRWNNLLSAWEPVEDMQSARVSATDERVTRHISGGGEFALVELSQPLTVLDLKLQPNPFSPVQINKFGEKGIAFSFIITSNKVALPLITAKIFNMSGDLAAILANQKPTAKGRRHFSWDGRTIDGRMARNGRYILQFTVEDGRNKQEFIKSIVLIQ